MIAVSIEDTPLGLDITVEFLLSFFSKILSAVDIYIFIDFKRKFSFWIE